MPPVRRLLTLAAAAVLGGAAVWFEAVQRTPEVKARKRERRLRRRIAVR